MSLNTLTVLVAYTKPFLYQQLASLAWSNNEDYFDGNYVSKEVVMMSLKT